jgi:hypothetical protein
MSFCEANQSFLAYIRTSIIQIAIQRVADFNRIRITENTKPERAQSRTSSSVSSMSLEFRERHEGGLKQRQPS